MKCWKVLLWLVILIYSTVYDMHYRHSGYLVLAHVYASSVFALTLLSRKTLLFC